MFTYLPATETQSLTAGTVITFTTSYGREIGEALTGSIRKASKTGYTVDMPADAHHPNGSWATAKFNYITEIH